MRNILCTLIGKDVTAQLEIYFSHFPRKYPRMCKGEYYMNYLKLAIKMS